MGSDSDGETIEGDVNVKTTPADWGKAKYDYYYTDYVDKDYPNKLSSKEDKLASIEQEEGLRVQKKLLHLDGVNLQIAYEDDEKIDLEFLELNNKLVLESEPKKTKRVMFEDQKDCDLDDGEDEDKDDDNLPGDEESKQKVKVVEEVRQRRPVNVAIEKNRGLTPYKKKEYRNPRVKHKIKYRKAISKRRRNIKMVQTEYHRYSGETAGIKTSTVKSIKLC